MLQPEFSFSIEFALFLAVCNCKQGDFSGSWLGENGDFQTENAPAIHSSFEAFLLAVFSFFRLLTVNHKSARSK